GLSERRDAEILGAADSEVMFAMILDRLDAGASMTEAVCDVLHRLMDLAVGKFNVMLTDGHTLVASREGNSLFTRRWPTTDPETPAALVVASEPFDDDNGW